MRVLCVYATRQVDSNLMMSSMVFDGLRQNGYHVDMIFLGYQKVLDVVEERYSKYFDNIEYLTIKESALKRTCDKWSKTRLLYSFYRHFVMDTLWRPYSRGDVARAVKGSYDVVLSFIPSVLCGFLARDVKAGLNARLPPGWCSSGQTRSRLDVAMT